VHGRAVDYALPMWLHVKQNDVLWSDEIFFKLFPLDGMYVEFSRLESPMFSVVCWLFCFLVLE
jgi:hypothetical protein